MSDKTNAGRRRFLQGAGAAVTAAVGARTWREHEERGQRTAVFIAKARSYDAPLERIIEDGLLALGLNRSWVTRKSVLLKPNLVEPSIDAPQINTHPKMVRAAAEVFRLWGAKEVFAAEGQGHCRDTDFVLEQSGLGATLTESRIEFVDLNHDEVFSVANRLGFTAAPLLTLPSALKRADLIVSMPKMKTHHWAGVTLSMKNLFGVMPGIVYGWPKNVLHHLGIPQSILDINGAVRPHLAIVDGIIAMEGDGPIMGTPRNAGVIVIGTNFPAVDATTARLMTINPWAIEYLAGASGILGPISENHIEQRGEPIAPVAQIFKLLDKPEFGRLRT